MLFLPRDGLDEVYNFGQIVIDLICAPRPPSAWADDQAPSRAIEIGSNHATNHKQVLEEGKRLALRKLRCTIVLGKSISLVLVEAAFFFGSLGAPDEMHRTGTQPGCIYPGDAARNA